MSRSQPISRLVLLVLALAAATTAQSPQLPLFEDGDRVVFVGDSITHSGKYHIFLADYYATRFPGRRITFLNGGIGGDVIPGALKRVASDILSRHPNKATIMLGMNDVGGAIYDDANPSADVLQSREAVLERYRLGMPELVEQLQKQNLQVAMITPSPYDETADIPTDNHAGKNGALAQCAAFVRAYAQQHGLPVIEFFSPMVELNAKVQAEDRTRTMIGKDRVHPGDEGHLVMAAQFLKAQNAPSLVADTRLQAKPGSTRFEFTYQPDALPFPLLDAYEKVDALVNFTEQFNREMLTVTGLAPGHYDLTMDGVTLGRYESTDLAQGVNIATNRSSPTQKQALAVSELVHQRAALSLTLRDILYVVLRLEKAGVATDDVEAARKLLGDSNARFHQFVEQRAHQPEIESQIAALTDEIYKANRPRPVRARLVTPDPN